MNDHIRIVQKELSDDSIAYDVIIDNTVLSAVDYTSAVRLARSLVYDTVNFIGIVYEELSGLTDMIE